MKIIIIPEKMKQREQLLYTLILLFSFTEENVTHTLNIS